MNQQRQPEKFRVISDEQKVQRANQLDGLTGIGNHFFPAGESISRVHIKLGTDEAGVK